MLPLEIVRIIFDFAFYPHEMPYIEVRDFNKCLTHLPRKKRMNRTFYMYYRVKAGIMNPWYYGGRTHLFYDPGLSPYVYFDYEIDCLGKKWTIEECTNCEKRDIDYLDGI